VPTAACQSESGNFTRPGWLLRKSSNWRCNCKIGSGVRESLRPCAGTRLDRSPLNTQDLLKLARSRLTPLPHPRRMPALLLGQDLPAPRRCRDCMNSINGELPVSMRDGRGSALLS